MSIRRVTSFVLFPAAVALATASYVYGRATASSRSFSSADPPRDASVERERRLAALEQEVQRLRAATAITLVRSEAGKTSDEPVEGAAVHAAKLGGTPADAPASAPEPLEPEQRERLAQEERVAFWDDLSRRVDTEPLDTVWRRETEAAILRVVPEQLGNVKVEEVLCASSICRAKLLHSEWARIPVEDFAKFMLNRESLGTMEMQLDTREAGVTTLYFLRPEQPPPE